MRSFATILLMLGLGLLVPACASLDRHTFHSTALLPTTLSLVDTTNDTVFWKMDIPTDHKLTVNFDRNGTAGVFKTSMEPATTMRWQLRPVNGKAEPRQGTLELSASPLIMKVAYRRSPELPGGSPEPDETLQDQASPANDNTPPVTDNKAPSIAAAPDKWQ